MKLVPVILCGGSGSRLWPLSRAMFPKQLLPLVGERTMLQETVHRLSSLNVNLAEPVVLCNEAHRFLATGQLQELGFKPTVVLEPVGRNTAPAAAVAALISAASAAEGEQTLLLILPADHVILDPAALTTAISRAIPSAEQGKLVTFGVVPTAPETGYGYIRAAEGQEDVRQVEQFVEKPDLQTAEVYLASGSYFWNSGMFLFDVDSFLNELNTHAPKMIAACEKAVAVADSGDGFLRLGSDAFSACPADSIDYAVMEKTELAAVTSLDAGWSDVGSWASLHEVSDSDASGNTTLGDVVAVDCRNSYLRAESRLLTAVGLEGCIVVETKDAVMVARGDRAQDVKKLVDSLTAAQREEVKLGRQVYRPWGSYDSLESAPGYQVKRLEVLPGAVLSLQLHHHRAEHWVVVAGIARITRDDEVFDLKPGEHAYIPVESKHRIENAGDETVQIIEVQVGDYLGEDDIVRFDDKYGREGRTD